MVKPLDLRKNWAYLVGCFFAGGIVLMIELAGARWLAPAFGSGLEVWAALLTVTLMAIALGAWGGGTLADRWPRPKTLSALWALVSLALVVVLPFRHPVMAWTSLGGPAWGALGAAFLLYGPALVLLSTVPPLSIRLSEPPSGVLGRTVGLFSAVGTFGSCLGALLTGFYLVPAFPIPRLFAGAAIFAGILALTLLPGSFRKPIRAVGLLLWSGLVLLLASGPGLGKRPEGLLVQETRQSLFGLIQVVERRDSRFLFLDGILQGGQVLPSGATLAPYTALLETVGRSAVPSPKRVLVVGLGAAILPNRFQMLGARVDTVEIDPEMVLVAERWFGFQPEAGSLNVMDGRRFLGRTEGPYDLIFMDAFSGEAVPGHLLTVETFKRCRELLSPNGALVLNYVGYASGPDARVPEIICAGLRKAFGAVDLFAMGPEGERDNLAIIARASERVWASAPGDLRVPDQEADKLGRFLEFRRPVREIATVFTDDWHPADWLDRENRLQWRKHSMGVYMEAGLDRWAL
jgi:spermidine synthase